MVLHSLFKIKTDPEGKQWILFEDFVKYLSQDLDMTHWISKLKSSVKRTFQRYGEFSENDNQTTISVASVLRFIFGHTTEYMCCKITAGDIQKLVTTSQVTNLVTEDTLSIYELYVYLAKTPLKKTKYENVLLHTKLPDEIPTLYTVHGENFSEEEFLWKISFAIAFCSGSFFFLHDGGKAAGVLGVLGRNKS